MLRLLSAVLLATVCPALRAQVASLGPAHAPSDVKAVGDPGDESGEVVLVSWTSPQAPPPSGLKLVGYRLYRSTNDRPWVGLLERTEVPEAPPGSPAETATGKQWTWRRYRYRVAALYAPPGRLWYMQGEALPRKAEEGGKLVGPAVLAQEALSGPSLSSKTVTLTAGPWELPVETPTTYTQTVGRWYFTKRTNVLIGCVLYGFVVLWFIYHARRGKDIYIRPIAGIEALDDAIGRASRSCMSRA
jgi:hypothetical protein